MILDLIKMKSCESFYYVVCLLLTNHLQPVDMDCVKGKKWLQTGAFLTCKMHRFRSSCACAKYHPGLCSPFIHSVVSNESVNGQ